VCLATLIAPDAHAQRQVLAAIDNIYAEEVRTAGFVLDRSQEVNIEAVAPGRRRTGQMLGNAWILDAQTRTVVWNLADAARNELSGDLLEIEDNLRLPAGPYEVYYASYVLWDGQKYDNWDNAENLGDLIRNVLDEIFNDKHDWRNWEESYRDEARNSGIRVHAGNGRSDVWCCV
jgi:hypothetical protein